MQQAHILSAQNALLFNLKPSPLPDALRLPRPVHRLDAATSGLLLIAKTASALRDLSAQFANKTIQKRYRSRLFEALEPLFYFQQIFARNRMRYAEFCSICSLTDLRASR